MSKKEADEIIALIAERSGTLAQAREWFNTTPIPAFGCRTAKQLVYMGEFERVKNYIAHLRSGGYA